MAGKEPFLRRFIPIARQPIFILQQNTPLFNPLQGPSRRILSEKTQEKARIPKGRRRSGGKTVSEGGLSRTREPFSSAAANGK